MVSSSLLDTCSPSATRFVLSSGKLTFMNLPISFIWFSPPLLTSFSTFRLAFIPPAALYYRDMSSASSSAVLLMLPDLVPRWSELQLRFACDGISSSCLSDMVRSWVLFWGSISSLALTSP